MSEYKAIPGYEGIYEVNKDGQVVRIGKAKGASLERILRPQDNGKGYKFVRLSKNGKVKTVYIKSLVASLFPEALNDPSQDTTKHQAEDSSLSLWNGDADSSLGKEDNVS
jgi:hypothetical protein